MRITSGKYRYRNLDIPEGIRPTTGKVREAVFSIVNQYIEGAVVLDLFAGSGGLGLEALSRGAKHCVFNEQNRKNAEILRKNIAKCGAQDSSTVLCKDFRKALSEVDAVFSLVLLDPPYREGFYEPSFHLLAENQLVEEGGIIVAEHLYDNKLPDTIECFEKIKEKRYGTIGVDVFIRR